jgi:hypothetical protein
MNTTSYPSPLDKLLTYGDCRKFHEWPNYLELGLGPEHANDLIRMATDEVLNTADSDGLEVWAPIHAMRALGQLRAEAAIQPIIGLFNRTEASDNYVVTGFSEVMGMIGPPAIPALTAFIVNPANKMYPRSYAGDSLAEIGMRHPAAREECIRSIVAGMQDFEKNQPELNGFFLANLLDLKAVEAASVIERAFAAGCVEETIAGDWEDVQVELGLLDARKTKPTYSLWNRIMQDDDDEEVDDEEDVDDEDVFVEPLDEIHNNRKRRKVAKVNSRRTMARKSRRQNRKKKKKK